MIKDNKNTNRGKVCSFYASDYHFEMISLPFIERSLEKKKEVVILTETNLEDSISKVMQRVNLQDNKKNDVLALNWKNDDTHKLDMILDGNKKDKEMVVFVKGNREYIGKIHQNFHAIKQESIQFIDCYDILEIGDHMSEIVKDYQEVLHTVGITDIA